MRRPRLREYARGWICRYARASTTSSTGSCSTDAPAAYLRRRAVALTPTVFDTLLYLVEHPAEVATRDQLLDAIWPRKTVDIDVSQTIYTLRRALVEAGGPDLLIQTVPGEGYRLACPVHARSNKTDAALLTPGSVRFNSRGSRLSRRRCAGSSCGASPASWC